VDCFEVACRLVDKFIQFKIATGQSSLQCIQLAILTLGISLAGGGVGLFVGETEGELVGFTVGASVGYIVGYMCGLAEYSERIWK